MISFKSSALFLSLGIAGYALWLPTSAGAQKGTKKPAQKASGGKAAAKPAPAAPSFDKDVVKFMGEFCIGCHSSDVSPGGVKIPKKFTVTDVQKNQALWAKVAQNVANKHMPPQGMPQPSQGQRDKLVKFIDGVFGGDCRLPDPGRVTMRRLNKEEYNNTVRDLLGVSIRPADDFPSDDVGYGFDNIGDVLSISALHMERYMSAAEKVAKAAIRIPRSKTLVVRGSELKAQGGTSPNDASGLLFFSNGTGTATFKVETDGWYRIRVRAGEQNAGPEFSKMRVTFDRNELGVVDVKAPRAKPEPYEFPVKLNKGNVQVSASFINDYFQAAQNGKPAQDRNMVVTTIELVGPTEDTSSYPASHRRMIPETPTAANRDEMARKALGEFATRAYRRPVEPTELDRLMQLFNLAIRTGEPYERGIQLGVQAVLCSPHFLYRVELDANPKEAKAIRTLNGYELASRLSYFLWSSMPDDELFALAKSGELVKPAVLSAQVKRMIRDPRAEALVDNFAMQWLQLRRLPFMQPDPEMFKTFNARLVDDMLEETGLTFKAVMLEDKSILEFIDSRTTYLNGRLAQHYGIPGVEGEKFQKVTLKDPNRGGLLTQASVLTVTSNPNRTSPTKRGRWILEQILGTPPPPPPPGVGDLADDKHFTENMTVRQRLEEHRKNPACANCHMKMDAMGFGFENFDPVGRWRTKDGKFNVDATGTIPGGKNFSGAAQLKKILLAEKDAFARAFGEKLLTFALGRGLQTADKCALDDVQNKASKSNYKFSAVVDAIVQSEPFRKRRGEGG